MTKDKMIMELIKMLLASDFDYVKSVFNSLINDDIESVEKMLGYEMLEELIDWYKDEYNEE